MGNPNLTMPIGLTLVSHFVLSQVQTWGSAKDQEFMATVLQEAKLTKEDVQNFEWFSFVIRAEVSTLRKKNPKHIPKTENLSKLILNSFTGVIYPADTMDFVHSIQIQADWTEGDEITEVWIFGKPGKPTWNPKDGFGNWSWQKGRTD